MRLSAMRSERYRQGFPLNISIYRFRRLLLNYIFPGNQATRQQDHLCALTVKLISFDIMLGFILLPQPRFAAASSHWDIHRSHSSEYVSLFRTNSLDGMLLCKT
jgi:hypothetical protein